MPMFKRRLGQRTDYEQRFALLKSGAARIVIRRSLSNVRVQFVQSQESGDKTVAEALSKNLKKFGWKGHGGNMSSAYLVGYLAAKKAKEKGVSNAIVDLGLQKSSRASNLYAAALGVKDAGVSVNIGSEALPKKDRVAGKHVAVYAEKLKKDNAEKYRKQFASYLKHGLNPEDLPKHFEEVKGQLGGHSAAKHEAHEGSAAGAHDAKPHHAKPHHEAPKPHNQKDHHSKE